MSRVSDSFAGVPSGRKLTLGELVRAIRLDLGAEEEAVHLYMAQADAADHPLAKKVLTEIANEERQHAGEFLRLLQLLSSDEEKYLARGAGEVDRIAAEKAKPAQVVAAARERKSPETL